VDGAGNWVLYPSALMTVFPTSPRARRHAHGRSQYSALNRLRCCFVSYLRHTGVGQWTTTLPSRADVGLCLNPCGTRLAVPAGDGKLYCMNTTDGSCLGEVDCGGEVRAAPATDPWRGLWWVMTHGKELLVIDPDLVDVVARWVSVFWEHWRGDNCNPLKCRVMIWPTTSPKSQATNPAGLTAGSCTLPRRRNRRQLCKREKFVGGGGRRGGCGS
jgi:hypothetical protein